MRSPRPHDPLRHVYRSGSDRICRECYNDPEEVYETLKRRGMELVTVTDHDSIDAVERSAGIPISS